MMNIALFILDWIILLPVTVLRLILIYLYGSRYKIKGLEFLDIMLHAYYPKFNYGKSKVNNKDRTNISKELKKYINK
jgi:hypothetical protein